MGGNLPTVLIGLGSLVLATLGLLVVRVDERSALARIWSWLQHSRKEREALERRISELEERVGLMSTVMQKESEMRDTQRDETAQRVADMKLRLDGYGSRIERLETNIVTDALELNTLGTKQKQLEAQLENYIQVYGTAEDRHKMQERRDRTER